MASSFTIRVDSTDTAVKFRMGDRESQRKITKNISAVIAATFVFNERAALIKQFPQVDAPANKNAVTFWGDQAKFYLGNIELLNHYDNEWYKNWDDLKSNFPDPRDAYNNFNDKSKCFSFVEFASEYYHNSNNFFAVLNTLRNDIGFNAEEVFDFFKSTKIPIEDWQHEMIQSTKPVF